MWLIPYYWFTITTDAPVAVVTQRLAAEVAPRTFFPFRRPKQPFQGVVKEEGFKVSRVIHYRNSFLPIIGGRFQAQEQGTVIQVGMRLHWLVMVFIAVWCGLIGGGFALEGRPGVGLPVVGLMWGLALAGFWFQAYQDRAVLTRILVGGKDEPPGLSRR
jgi:hypothetical protein